MKRRILPLSLFTASLIVVYACSSDETPATPTPEPVPGEEGGPPTPIDGSIPDKDSSVPDTGKADTSVPASSNPIEGIAMPAAVAALDNVYTEGPQWFGDGLYYSEAKADGFLLKLTPPATVAQMRTVVTPGTVPLGNTYNEKTMKLLTLEVNATTNGAQIVSTDTTGAPPRVGTPLVLTTDAGTAPTFDSPNDLVVRKTDGTIYITDPSYQAQQGGTVTTNHLWRIKPVTNEVFETQLAGRPNGIALSPNDSILYVSFTEPFGNPPPPPTVMKYPVNADGSLGAATQLISLPPGGVQAVNSLADGLAVDSAGNVYVAVRNGVEVIKPDGTKWGKIPTTKEINGLAFGGADKKTLFMTSRTGMMTVTLKVAGLVQ